MYKLITANGNEIIFSVKEAAELFRTLYGGTIQSTEELHTH